MASTASPRVTGGWPLQLLALALLAATAATASAQRTTGAIIGTVRDGSGGVLAGATVVLSSPAVPGNPETVSGESGRYQFLALPPGEYAIAVSLSGFKSLSRTGVTVTVGSTVEVDATLEVGELAESVMVTADAALVNTTSSQVASRLDTEFLRAAPTNRVYSELLRMGQGVDVATSTAPVAFTVFGSGVNDNAFQLDGADQTTSHAANTAPAVFPNPEVIEEIEFLSLGAPAEYGGFMGGVFNAVTRQGSNAFHGDANYFWQGRRLTDRNTTTAVDGGRPYRRDRFHDASIQLGGPVLRDRLWFFASYQDFDDFFSQAGADPRFPGGTTVSRGLVKLTWQPSAAHRVTATLNPSRFESIASSPLSDPSAINRGPQTGLTPSVVWNATLSSTRTLEVRGNYYYSNYTARPPAGEPEVRTRVVALDTGRVSGGVQLVGESIYRKASVAAKVTDYTDRFLGGSHDLRLGVQYQRGRADNTFYYNDLVYTLAGVPQNGYVQIQSEYGANPSQLGVFVDDSYRPHARLTLDVGLRYDYGNIDAPAYPKYDRFRQKTGESFPAVPNLVTWHTVAPRLGFNLKLDDAGTTVVKGHAGRYFQSTGVAAAFYRVLPSSTPQFAFSGRYDAAGDPIDLVPITQASNRRMDDGVGAPRTDQYVLGVERQLTSDVAVQLHGVYKRGSHYLAWEDIGGQYVPVTYMDSIGTDASGQPITVQRLTSSPSDRFFLLTDPDEMFSRYRGLVLGATKRMSHGWQLSTSLTWSKSTGRLISSNTGPASNQNSTPIFSSFGQNPNDFVNSNKLLIGDRPWLSKTQFVAALPWGITTAVGYQFYSGRPWGRTIRVDGLGLTTTIRAEPLDGRRRLDPLNLLDLRLEKRVPLGGGVSAAVFGDALNVLNGDTLENVASTLGTSGVFGVPTTVQMPRRLLIGARVRF